MSTPLIDAWHEVVARGDLDALHEMLAEDACFHSPVVHRPQQGRELTALYLGAAFRVFEGTGFRYVREIASGHDAALEFVATVDGIEINGVDLIHWDAYGKISDFKVMIRPWKAIEKLREKMAAMLEVMTAGRTRP
jgi:SnoaL-like domain